MSNINSIPSNSYTYVSPNCTASTSWLDHMIAFWDNLISEISIIFGHTIHDHVSLFCKLSLPNAAVRVVNELAKLFNRENTVFEEE